MPSLNPATLAAVPDAAAAASPPDGDVVCRLGAMLISIVAGKHSRPMAEAWARSLVWPTLPGTPARAAQDASWARLVTRLIKVVDGEGA